MYERHYGYRYKELGGYPGAAAIAKAIRADVKVAVAEGLLPARWTYSVRSKTYSMGQSVDIEVRNCPDAWVQCEGVIPGTHLGCGNVWCKGGGQYRDQPSAEYHNVLTEEAQAAKMTLQRIHGAYNHTGSETQTDYFDVRYYGIVTFEDAGQAEFRAEQAATKAARRAAKDAGTKVGKLVNVSRGGTRKVHWVVETTEGKKALLCGAALWRSGLHGMVDKDATVTCSRCVKKGGAQ